MSASIPATAPAVVSACAERRLSEEGAMVMLCGMNRAQEYRAGPRDTSFLSILDGGFGLQYSTLLEYREGTGMVLFCQTDVTARSEAIPPPRR